MKWLNLLYGIYFLMLSCIPCFCADQYISSGIVADISQPIPKENDHEEENCQPFCSCCAPVGNYYMKMLPVTENVLLNSPVKYSIYHCEYASLMNCSIWQPPRQV